MLPRDVGRRWAGLAVALGVGLGAGCTGVDLEPIVRPPVVRDDKLQIDASFCTRGPGTRVSPLRVLFVVDSSESMRITDPVDPVTMETARERAVRDAWTRLLDRAPTGVRVGIVRFSAGASSNTQVDEDGDGLPDRYYSADRTQLEQATQALQVTDRTTNYLGALNEAYFEMRTELRLAALETLPLSKYVVVFVSDGLPDTDSAEERENTAENILAGVDALVELAQLFRVGEFAFHTVYVSAGEGPAVDQEAQDLLQAMAMRGQGSFRSFPSRESLSFLFIDFAVIRRVFTLRGLTAVNTNTVMDARQVEILASLAPPPGGMPMVDAGVGPAFDLGPVDAGVPDGGLTLQPVEVEDPRGFVDVSEDGALSCGEPLVDSDGDGLADLLEAELESNAFLADTDDDGARDRLEWELRESGLDMFDPSDSDCFVANRCLDEDGNGVCDCVFDLDLDGLCDCAEADSTTPCIDAALRVDCVDADLDGFCDCPDFDQDGRCDYDDLDGDGLHDCEEIFYGTARKGADSDADGLADPVEVRFRSSPVEEDRQDDLDWDATVNGVEVRTSGDPWCNDSSVRSRVAYRYDVNDLGLDGSRTCYEARIENITLVPTLPNPEAYLPDEQGIVGDGLPGNGWNRILVYAGEVAFDDPDAFPAYRVACVMARYEPLGDYREPASGRVPLRDEDFVPLEDFDADRDCLFP